MGTRPHAHRLPGGAWRFAANHRSGRDSRAATHSSVRGPASASSASLRIPFAGSRSAARGFANKRRRDPRPPNPTMHQAHGHLQQLRRQETQLPRDPVRAHRCCSTSLRPHTLSVRTHVQPANRSFQTRCRVPSSVSSRGMSVRPEVRRHLHIGHASDILTPPCHRC